MSWERESACTPTLGTVSIVLGAALLVLGVLSDPTLVAHFHVRDPLSSEALAETVKSRRAFAAAGIALVVTGGYVRRRVGQGRPLALGWTRFLVALLTTLGPLFVLERGARPFVERLTTIFEADREFGWRNRALADDTYWGSRVRINAARMRGPERELAKPPGVRRVLVLGDSVVFGLMLEDDAQTFPGRLERKLNSRSKDPFECLNAGVCGWSPLQERRFLEREGARWQPDLVVLGFVLNDVAERAGGGGVAQLAYTRPEGLPDGLAESGIYLALRELALRHALAGDSPQALAHKNRLTPYHVILQSDSDPVQAAWKKVLPELEEMSTWCRARALPFVLVAFPFALQLREPEANAPQGILADFAQRRALSFLDLLPALLAAQRERALDERDLFFDGLHPSALGNELAAEELARFLVDRNLLP